MPCSTATSASASVGSALTASRPASTAAATAPAEAPCCPYLAPIADQVGALQPYLGPIAKRLRMVPVPHGAGGDALVKFPGGEALTAAAMLEAPGEARPRHPAAVLPYVAPIADRLGALQAYAGSIAERLRVVSIPHGAGTDALVNFPGGMAFMVAAMLEAPVEVAAKSSHSTRAAMRTGEAAAMLRFVRRRAGAGHRRSLLSKSSSYQLSHVK